LKDIEKFMRDHGAELVLDFGSDDLENKVESIIRELRNVLKDSIVEGGKGYLFNVMKKIQMII
jgi:hypothetical protein